MPEFLEIEIGKFTFRVAADRLYSGEGLWVLRLAPRDGDRVRVGVTDFLQQRSGDVAFVTVEPPGTGLRVGDDLADIETIKVTMTLASPIGGTIVAANEALRLQPELVNESPYEKGWLAEIDPTDRETWRASLLDANAYSALVRSQAREELERP